jgi:hypothetical protein
MRLLYKPWIYRIFLPEYASRYPQLPHCQQIVYKNIFSSSIIPSALSQSFQSAVSSAGLISGYTVIHYQLRQKISIS